MKKVVLFFTGFLQVSLVTAQTWMVANNVLCGVFGVGFIVSLVWTVNVKKIALGNWFDRFIYSFGAGAGAILGLVIAKLITGGK